MLFTVRFKLFTILPEADFVSVGVFERAQDTRALVLCRIRTDSLQFQFSQRFFDIIDSQAKARVSILRELPLARSRHNLEQHSVDIEARNDIA